MHIYEGVLSNSPEGIAVLSAGIVATAAGTALGLRKMDYERVPQVAMLSSAFFVISLITVPLGGTSVHLVLSGLVGLILGWAAFPAMLIALILQAMFFGMGGPTTLGINTLSMALPAVVCHHIFRKALHSKSESITFLAGLGAGALAVVLGALIVAAAMLAAGTEFKLVAGAALLVHLVVAPVEGLITGIGVVFLRKVRPELLEAPFLAPTPYPEVIDA